MVLFAVRKFNLLPKQEKTIRVMIKIFNLLIHRYLKYLCLGSLKPERDNRL